jgi:protein SCO1
MKYLLVGAVLFVTNLLWAAQRYPATGMVLTVDQPHKSFVVSCQSIPGFMEAMTMPFDVRQTAELQGVAPGMTVEFMLVVDRSTSYAEHIQIRRYESVEQDPLIARQLKLLTRIANPSAATVKVLTDGQKVPDFTLLDQNRHPLSLSEFAGKVIALNFIYTSCALPNFCYRITNNFGVLQRRFK